jgi:beta-glucosidase
MPARAWGVEYLSELERAARVLHAGVDQFGGEQRPELIVELVNKGIVAEDRLDVSVRRLLREKFVLGLFENPFVDVDAAVQVVGNPYFRRLGNDAQRKAMTLLTNKNDILPFKPTANMTFYIEGLNATYLKARNLNIVSTPAEASIALMRLQAPYEPRPGGFEANYHAGSLEYNATEKARQAAIFAAVQRCWGILGLGRKPFWMWCLELMGMGREWSRWGCCLLIFRGVWRLLRRVVRMCLLIRRILCLGLGMG